MKSTHNRFIRFVAWWQYEIGEIAVLALWFIGAALLAYWLAQ